MKHNKLIAVLAMAAIALLIALGYTQDWTGFSAYIDSVGEHHPTKTLWDWLELLIIPSVLAAGAIWLNQRERRAEREITEQRTRIEREIAVERNREEALQRYLDRITDLLLEKNLRNSEQESEIQDIARARTATTLRELDKMRKNVLLNFLRAANLVGEDDSVQLLREVDLNGADLHEIDMGWTVLSQADLHGANLVGTNFARAVLEGTNLREADLREADLRWARLSAADMVGADLREADLREADLRMTNVVGADLRGVKLNWADTRGILYTEATQWPDGFTPKKGINLDSTAVDRPPELKDFHEHLFTALSGQPAWIHDAFDYGYCLLMVEADKMRLVETVPGESGEICTFETVAGDTFSIIRPAMDEEYEAKLIATLREMLEKGGVL